MLPRQCQGFPDITLRQHLPADGILQGQQPRPREVWIIRLHRRRNFLHRQRPIRCILNRLRLNTPQHRRPAPLILIGVRVLPNNILIPPPAMRHQRAKIAHRPTRAKQPRLKPQPLRQCVLQSLHRRIIPKHIIPQRRRHHGLAHGRGGLGDGIAAEVDHELWLGWRNVGAALRWTNRREKLVLLGIKSTSFPFLGSCGYEAQNFSAIAYVAGPSCHRPGC